MIFVNLQAEALDIYQALRYTTSEMMLAVNKMPLAPSKLCLLRGEDWAA